MTELCVGRHEDDAEAEMGYLCFDHFSRLSMLLRQLPNTAVWLEMNIAPSSSAGAEPVSGSREAPMPLRQDILDLIGPTSVKEISRTMTLIESHFKDWPADQHGGPSIFDVVKSWSRLCCEEHGVAWPEHHTITGFTRYLSSQLSWITEQPWVDDFLIDIEKITSRAERAAPRKPEMRRVKRPCTRCGMMALITHVAEGVVRCERGMGGCGASDPVTDYEWNSMKLDTA